MTPKQRDKHIKRCAKAYAKAEWRRYLPQAEAHIQALMINPETAPQLEGRIKFKVHNHEGPLE